MASDEDDIPQISDLAGECEDLFEDLQSLLSGISDKASRVVQGCQQRFERWASYLGVFAAPQASLDSRLKSTPDIRDLVIQLLLTLKRNIQYGIKFESTRPKLGSILVDNDRTKTEVGEQFEVAQQAVLPMTQAALDGIHGAIDRLHRIGTTIRKSSTSNFLSKGRRLGQNHNDEDEFFKNIASLVISGLYPSISEKFIEQLARSILVRKQRLSYQRKHQRKLEKRYKPQKETVIILEPVPDIELSHVEIQQKLDESSGVETSVPPNDTGTISSRVDAYTATLPSVINSLNFRLHLNEAPRAALGPPSTTSIAHGNPYPSPPKTQPGDKYCQCEWCFVELEVLEDKAQWRRAWRDHFKTDLQPYVCISEDCSEKSLYFASLRKWRNHMDDFHGLEWTEDIHRPTIWYCNLGQHGYKEFLTENGLHEHLSQVHSDEISSEQFDMVTRRNSLSVPRGSTVCPLCAQDVLSLNRENSEMEPGDYGTLTPIVPNKAEKKVAFQVIEAKCSNDTELNTSDSEEEFEEDDQVNHIKVAAHVAKHLKSLAFVSLRYFKDDDYDTVSVESQDAALEPSEDRSSSKRRCGDHHFDLDSSLSFEDIPLDERDLNDGLSEGIRSLASDSMIISTIEENIERTDFRPDGEDEPKILDWLTTYDYSKSQASFFKQTQEATGEWLLKSDQYRKWLENGHQMLFCPGSPGSGKTILASIVIDDLSGRVFNSGIGIGYIFFDSRRSQDQNVNELLSSLLRQLASCRSTLPSGVRKLHEHHTIRGTRPSTDDIFTTLLSVSQEFRRTFFVIDAFDECQEDNGCRQNFTSRLLQLYNTCNSSVFVTSRTLATITNAFGVGDVVEIRAYEADEGTHLDPSISKSGLSPPTENETPTKWAILIGVDHYISGISRPGINFHNLKGCVEDVNQTEKYLRTALGVREAHIWRLTATTPSDIQQPAAAVSGYHMGPIEPVEPRSQWPTYKNIISRLQMITQMAEPNDIVYIHYSGHGARVNTIFDQLKGARGFDEAIVPTDICSGGRYVRNLEIAYLLQKMVKKELVVTAVLDCCYTVFGSRGNMRNTSLRSIPQIDNVRLDSDFSVLPREELATLWNKSTDGKGSFEFGSYPLPEPRGYTVLAACQANEYAMEEQFDNKTQGLLTYFLIETLRNSPRSQHLTYYRLWSLVAAKVRKHNSQQTVVLGGEADHLFLSSDRCLSFSTATITDLREAEGKTIAKLNVGGLQGLSKGIAFNAWPIFCNNTEVSKPIALLRVSKVKYFVSNAEVEWYDDSKGRLEPGCLVKPHPARVQRPVQFIRSEPREINNQGEDAIQFIRSETGEDYNGTNLVPIINDSTEAFFRVHIRDGSYIILDRMDQPFDYKTPTIAIHSKDSATTLMRYLTNIARYFNILDLENADTGMPWLSASATSCVPDEGPSTPRITTDPGNRASVPNELVDIIDCKLVLLIVNISSKKLYITLIYLDSDWTVKQIHPDPFARGENTYQRLEPGETLRLPLKLSIPDDSAAPEIINTLKIFATAESTSFRWLKILRDYEEFDEPEPKNAFEALLVDLTEPKMPRVSAFVPSGWSTTRVAIRYPKRIL